MSVMTPEKKYETIVGSWFNSGFHGHFRSLPRNYYNTFRELSKPSPPRKFMLRLQEGRQSHAFTKHDNRKKFPNDINQLTAHGLKKDLNKPSNRFNKTLIRWDKSHDSKRYISVYRRESKSGPLNLELRNCMKDWGPIDNKMEFSTMYREHYCHQVPVPVSSVRPPQHTAAELRYQPTPPPPKQHTRPTTATASSKHSDTTANAETTSGKKPRPHTTTLVSRPRQQSRTLDLRPEWMGGSFVKQRNQSEIELANEYHGYNQWEERIGSNNRWENTRDTNKLLAITQFGENY